MWNIASECVAGIFVCIIFVYSYGSHMVPTVKNLIFQGCLTVTSIPYIIYFNMVLLNISNKKIFYLDPETGYGRGPWMITVYLIFYSYCFLCFVIVTIGRNILTVNEQRILYSFPAICVIVILIQYLMPSYILTGSAAACALLIVYLFLQNKRITVDLLTGICSPSV